MPAAELHLSLRPPSPPAPSFLCLQVTERQQLPRSIHFTRTLDHKGQKPSSNFLQGNVN